MDRPLTDRILDRLRGGRTAWAAAWIALIAVRPFIYYGVDALLTRSAAPLGQIRYAVSGSLILAYMAALSLWGVRKLADDAAAIEPTIDAVLPEGRAAAPKIIQGVCSTAGPLVLTAALTAFSAVRFTENISPPAILVTLPLTALVNLPLMTEFWVLVAVLTGFYRLGRFDLALDRHFANPSLGLSLIGVLGFSGFWIFFATVGPYLLANARRPIDLAVGVVFAVGPPALLFTSLYRLHVQMVAARTRYVTWARALYDAVMRPAFEAPEPSPVLRREPLLVSAAEAVVRRAEQTQEWPFTDRMMGIMLGILGGVLASLAGRVLLSGVGL
jgi:hypothetical protein